METELCNLPLGNLRLEGNINLDVPNQKLYINFGEGNKGFFFFFNLDGEFDGGFVRTRAFIKPTSIAA